MGGGENPAPKVGLCAPKGWRAPKKGASAGPKPQNRCRERGARCTPNQPAPPGAGGAAPTHKIVTTDLIQRRAAPSPWQPPHPHPPPSGVRGLRVAGHGGQKGAGEGEIRAHSRGLEGGESWMCVREPPPHPGNGGGQRGTEAWGGVGGGRG